MDWATPLSTASCSCLPLEIEEVRQHVNGQVHIAYALTSRRLCDRNGSYVINRKPDYLQEELPPKWHDTDVLVRMQSKNVEFKRTQTYSAEGE